MSAQKDYSESPDSGLRILHDLVTSDGLVATRGRASRRSSLTAIRTSSIRVVSRSLGDLTK
jgi:hypothetical protein